MSQALPPQAAEGLRQASQWLQSGEAEKAARLLDQLLQHFPRHAEVHYAFGVAASTRGDSATALAALQQALKLDRSNPWIHFQLGTMLDAADRPAEAAPRYRDALRLQAAFPEAHYNLGLALHRMGDSEGAMRAYRNALNQRPNFLEALNNLGNLLQAAGRHDEAMRHFSEAIRLRPDFAVPYNNLGNSLVRLGQRAQAIEAYRRAVTLAPRFAEAAGNLAEQLQADGQHDAAIVQYEALLAQQPDHPQARFALAALKGETPAAAPDSFVQKVFDDLAPRFEAHLVDTLDYRIPAELFTALQPWLAKRGKVDVLDLGCGTGLFGEAVRPYAQSLAGVDLAARMVEVAQSRGHYDRVQQGELTSFLQGEAAASADLIAATDVFVYVGDLTRIFAEAARVLRTGGRFGFSVERIDQGDFALRPTGRFAQSADYIRRLATEHGFRVEQCIETPIRKEASVPIPGHLWVLERVG
jgi:predicted TPR repeat methyltransferase